MYSPEIMEFYEKIKSMSAELAREYHTDHRFGKVFRYIKKELPARL